MREQRHEGRDSLCLFHFRHIPYKSSDDRGQMAMELEMKDARQRRASRGVADGNRRIRLPAG